MLLKIIEALPLVNETKRQITLLTHVKAAEEAGSQGQTQKPVKLTE